MSERGDIDEPSDEWPAPDVVRAHLDQEAARTTGPADRREPDVSAAVVDPAPSVVEASADDEPMVELDPTGDPDPRDDPEPAADLDATDHPDPADRPSDDAGARSRPATSWFAETDDAGAASESVEESSVRTDADRPDEIEQLESLWRRDSWTPSTSEDEPVAALEPSEDGESAADDGVAQPVAMGPGGDDGRLAADDGEPNDLPAGDTGASDPRASAAGGAELESTDLAAEADGRVGDDVWRRPSGDADTLFEPPTSELSASQAPEHEARRPDEAVGMDVTTATRTAPRTTPAEGWTAPSLSATRQLEQWSVLALVAALIGAIPITWPVPILSLMGVAFGLVGIHNCQLDRMWRNRWMAVLAFGIGMATLIAAVLLTTFGRLHFLPFWTSTAS